MPQSRNSYQVWWVYDQTITAVTSVVMPIGCNLLGGFNAAGAAVGLVRDLPYFAFSLEGTYTTATLTLRAEVNHVQAGFTTWWTHPHTGSTNIDTVHNMAAPYGSPAGVMGMGVQYLRLSVDVGGAGSVTGFRFTARAWKE